MSEMSSRDVEVNLTHLVRDPLHENEKPYELWMKTRAGWPKTNCQYEDKRVTVHDLRTLETEFDVERNGFKYIRHTSHSIPRFDDLAWDTPPTAYLEETVDMVQRQLGAELVLMVNWAYRENKLRKVNVPFDFDGTSLRRSHPQRPVHLAHSGNFCFREYIHRQAFDMSRKTSRRLRVLVGITVTSPNRRNAPTILTIGALGLLMSGVLLYQSSKMRQWRSAILAPSRIRITSLSTESSTRT